MKKFTKNQYMWDLDDGAVPVTEEARAALKYCEGKEMRRGLWLQQRHRSVFNSEYEAKVKLLEAGNVPQSA